MSDLFSTYESDFKLSYSEAQQKLEQIYGLQDENKRVDLMRDVESAVDECRHLIEQMTLEASNISTSARSSYNAKLRTYKFDLERASKDLKSLMDDSDRRKLLGNTSLNGGIGGAASDNTLSYSQRQALLNSNASLDRSSQRLNDATRTAMETEDVGAGILDNLRGQREQILNAREVLNEADSYVDRSMKTLKTMTRRLATNKMITYSIIAVLIILIFLVLINKFS